MRCSLKAFLLLTYVGLAVGAPTEPQHGRQGHADAERFLSAPPNGAIASPSPSPGPDQISAIPSSGPALAQRQQNGGDSGFWVETIKRQGAPFKNENYTIFRNVKDYGAKGDGKSDDTEAINKAVSDGNRCGAQCGSSTTTPAIVYFPSGTYAVSKPIIQYYMTQFVGDATNLPVLKAMANFEGMAVIDSDPYNDDGSNWYINQNNFYRAIRNFVIDLTGLDQSKGAGIHWQVAQATSLQNIRFEMKKGGGDANKQQGIFMDNGSGGFIADLTFNGGGIGAFLGAQQYTLRNMTFNDCQTAIFMNWDWVFAFKSMYFNNCGLGLNMTTGGSNQTVGSVLLSDSVFKGTKQGIATVFGQKSQPEGAGSLVLSNVDFTGAQQGVVEANGKELVKGGGKVESYVQGNTFTSGNAISSQQKSMNSRKRQVSKPSTTMTVSQPAATPESPEQPSSPIGTSPIGTGTSPAPAPTTPAASPTPGSGGSEGSCSNEQTLSSARVSATQAGPSMPTALLGDDKKVAERSRPQYETVPASSFVSIKSKGAKGDGSSDDTEAFKKAIKDLKDDEILYIDHGLYVLTDTIEIPKNIKVTGEVWPVLLASGTKFGDHKNPIPLLQVGKAGDVGKVELSDFVVGTKGPAPGAVLIEWNVAGEKPDDVGMWDVHARIGGFAGSDLQSDTCAKTPKEKTTPNEKCEGAFAMMRITESGAGYFENCWWWVADHELDREDHGQINIYNGRGVLIESNHEDKGVILYGTASEHSTLYNYQVDGAKNVYMSVIQTETPYFQSNPTALVPFVPGEADGGSSKRKLLRRTDEDNGDDDEDNEDKTSPAPGSAKSWNDPTFGDCKTAQCKKAWGLRVVDSQDVYILGAGLYSFFENYGQKCLKSEDCQQNMLELDCSGSGGGGGGDNATSPAVSPAPGATGSAGKRYAIVARTDDEDEDENASSGGGVWIYALSTKASHNMVTIGGKGVVPIKGNKSTFCETVGLVKA